MAFSDSIRLHARYRGDKPALIEGTATWSYRTLDRAINGACYALIARGVKRGDIVAIALSDTAQNLITQLAVSRLGAVILPVDVRWTEAEKLSVTKHFGARFVLVDTKLSEAREGWIQTSPEWITETDRVYTDPEVGPDTPLVLSLSSGTTGMPKGPRASHRQYESRFSPYWIDMGLNARDVYVSATPLYYGGGRTFALALLYAGATVHMFPPPYEPEELIAQVNRVGATAMFLVPTLLRRLLHASTPSLAFPTLKTLISSGSMLFMEERKEIKRRLTNNLIEFYSSTEGGAVSVLTPSDFDRHPDSVGRPCFRVDVEVVDAEHNPLPYGEIGRLRYRSPSSAQSYFMGESGDAFRDGWFYPGDLASFNSSGYLFLRGRSKDMIIRGGVNIYPADIERVLMDSPGVTDAAVVGVPSAEMGEEVVAFVVGAPPQGAAGLVAICKERLARYKVPKAIYFLEALPKNSFGKVLKNELAKRAEALHRE